MSENPRARAYELLQNLFTAGISAGPVNEFVDSLIDTAKAEIRAELKEEFDDIHQRLCDLEAGKRIIN